MEFTLSTDTSCDVLKTNLDKDGIPYIPLSYILDEETYEDDYNKDDQYKDFYQKIRQGAMPTTSQINPELHSAFFRKILAGGAKAIVHLSLSGGLSATYESAVAGAKEAKRKFPNAEIYVIDTLSATQAHGYLLDKALQMRNECLSAQTSFDLLNQIKGNVHAWVVADDLMHLKRGGRLSSAAATIGTLLRIKPILILNSEGKLSVVHKAKGEKKALSYIVEKFLAHCKDYKTTSVWLASADCADKIEYITKLLRAAGCKGEIKTGWIGPVIGAHTGVGTLGLIFEGSARSQ